MTAVLKPFSRLERPRASFSLRRLKRCAAMAALLSCATPHLAAAADTAATFAPPPCPGEIVDVYLSLWEKVGGTPTLPIIKLGPPQAHLRLPRENLILIAWPSVDVPMTDCSQKSFAASSALYLRPTRLAGYLGIPYDEPRVRDDLIRFDALDPTAVPPVPTALAPVDDTDDREGTARKGAWVVEPPTMPYIFAHFCLSPPAPAGQCYAGAGYGMGYKTGHVIIDARGFKHASLTASKDREPSLITIADLDHYFAFLRRLADAVVVTPSNPTK